ncbi:MAG: DUF2970 domain-containing protein [Gammaproteobacteria bacterium]|nr:DUF2970 domain-containing protein [Gammaproteobacteria bacterium]
MKVKKDDTKETDNVSFLQTFGSVLAAMFGVQTEKNRQRDFNKGKLWHYILGGLIFAALFITVLVTIVQYALSGL